jgi:hypothetical protein
VQALSRIIGCCGTDGECIWVKIDDRPEVRTSSRQQKCTMLLERDHTLMT